MTAAALPAARAPRCPASGLHRTWAGPRRLQACRAPQGVRPRGGRCCCRRTSVACSARRGRDSSRSPGRWAPQVAQRAQQLLSRRCLRRSRSCPATGPGRAMARFRVLRLAGGRPTRNDGRSSGCRWAACSRPATNSRCRSRRLNFTPICRGPAIGARGSSHQRGFGDFQRQQIGRHVMPGRARLHMRPVADWPRSRPTG